MQDILLWVDIINVIFFTLVKAMRGIFFTASARPGSPKRQGLDFICSFREVLCPLRGTAASKGINIYFFFRSVSTTVPGLISPVMNIFLNSSFVNPFSRIVESTDWLTNRWDYGIFRKATGRPCVFSSVLFHEKACPDNNCQSIAIPFACTSAEILNLSPDIFCEFVSPFCHDTVQIT